MRALEYLADAVDTLIDSHCVSDAEDEWDVDGLMHRAQVVLADRGRSPSSWLDLRISTDEMYDIVMKDATAFYSRTRGRARLPEVMREVERQVMLQIIDQRWREHLERDGLPAGGHQPARDGSEGSARRMAA